MTNYVCYKMPKWCDYMIVKQARVPLSIASTWVNDICDFCFIFSCPYLPCKRIYLTYQSSSNSMKISVCVPSTILFEKPYKKFLGVSH